MPTLNIQVVGVDFFFLFLFLTSLFVGIDTKRLEMQEQRLKMILFKNVKNLEVNEFFLPFSILFIHPNSNLKALFFFMTKLVIFDSKMHGKRSPMIQF